MQANRWLVIRWDFTALRSHFGDHCCENHSLCCSTEDSSPSCVSPGFYLYLCSDPSPLFNPLLSPPYLGTQPHPHVQLQAHFFCCSFCLFTYSPPNLTPFLRNSAQISTSFFDGHLYLFVCLFVCLMNELVSLDCHNKIP